MTRSKATLRAVRGWKPFWKSIPLAVYLMMGRNVNARMCAGSCEGSTSWSCLLDITSAWSHHPRGGHMRPSHSVRLGAEMGAHILYPHVHPARDTKDVEDTEDATVGVAKRYAACARGLVNSPRGDLALYIWQRMSTSSWAMPLSPSRSPPGPARACPAGGRRTWGFLLSW